MQAAADSPAVGGDRSRRVARRAGHAVPRRPRHRRRRSCATRIERHVPLNELVAAHPDLGDEALELLEPGVAVTRRTTPGGAGPGPVADQLQRFRQRVDHRRGPRCRSRHRSGGAREPGRQRIAARWTTGPRSSGTRPTGRRRRRTYAVAGRRHWSTDEFTWGQYRVPEAEVGVLPDVAGKDVVEIGCGTAYISAWLARRGAAHASSGSTRRRRSSPPPGASSDEFGPRFPLVRGAGEARAAARRVASTSPSPSTAPPSGPTRTQWLPEAARLLRPGGELVFLANSVIFVLCAPDEEAPAGRALVRDQAGLHRVEYTDDEGVEFHLPHGEMLRLLRRCGFEVVDLVELYAPGRRPRPAVHQRRVGDEVADGGDLAGPQAVTPLPAGLLRARQPGRGPGSCSARCSCATTAAPARIVEVEAYRGEHDPGQPRLPRQDGAQRRDVRARRAPVRVLHLRHALVRQRRLRRRRRRDRRAAAGARADRRPRPDAARSGRCARDVDLANGPAKLCQAFGLDRAFDGADLVTGDRGVTIVDDGVAPPRRPGNSTRVGLSAGQEHPWRWWIDGDPHVSKGRPSSAKRFSAPE